MARGNRAGRGGKRGGNRGGQRGRGFSQNGRGRGRGGFNPIDDLDFTVYDFDENAASGGLGGGSGFNSPRGQGRGRGSGYSTPRGGFRGGYNTPRGGFNNRGGYDSPRGRGRGKKPFYKPIEDYDVGMGRGSPTRNQTGPYRGRMGKNWESRMSAGVPLSRLLNEDRPLLRPVIFVRSVHTATLFQEEEEILKPLVEEVANDEKSHVPTADQITRVFGGDAGEDDEDGEREPELEEIDFSEVGRLQAEVDAAVAEGVQQKSEVTVVEQKFTGFYIDTTPSAVVPAHAATPSEGPVLGEEDEDEEIIVYVAPHPRAGPITPPSEAPIPFPKAIPEAVDPPLIATRAVSVHEILIEVLAAEESSPRPIDTKAIHETTALESSQTDVVMAGQELQDTTRVPPAQSAAELAPTLEESPNSPQPNVMRTTSAPEAATTETEEGVPMVQDATIPVSTGSPEEAASAPSDMPAQLLEEQSISHGSDIPFLQPPEALTTVPKAAEESTTPLTSEATPQQAPAFEKVTFSAFTTSVTPRRIVRRAHPVNTPRSLIKKNKPRRKALRGFGLYGASLAEAYLQEDSRKDERRIGDSDLDWGSESEDAGVDELSASVGAMDIDEDVDIAAMASFVKSMSAGGSKHVTMDDIADTEMMRREDEENDSVSDDEEGTDSADEDVMKAEESMLIAEGVQSSSSDEGSDEDGSTDDEETPRRGFQTRLKRMRENSKGKRRADAEPESSDDDDDDDAEMVLGDSRADQDESYISQIKALVANDDGRKDRKAHDKLFEAIHNGDLHPDDYEEFASEPAPRNKDKYKDLSPELQKQWEKDRAKKAENKRKRALDRLAAAADPLSKKKGGKKGMKAALVAARSDTPIEIPNRVVDLATLEQQIRRFLDNLGGKQEMVLPPCGKETRKSIHKLAEAFNLKSKSKGSGKTRYTTLTKTTRSGVGINERKVRGILKTAFPDWISPDGRNNTRAYSLAKHQEGEEVGKAAPKIGETNVGFRMLAAMGWSEGNQIGLSGGLDVPLVAKMKKTKLGLGATA